MTPWGLPKVEDVSETAFCLILNTVFVRIVIKTLFMENIFLTIIIINIFITIITTTIFLLSCFHYYYLYSL